ncbi:MAG: Arc family DNA-binding protein [Planctomycetes bacterium]|nr:Arc family DNA-binding protein [Planctomycetota bacterium]
MANLTVRNIPDDVMENIRILARRDRRSLNYEILVLLEAGLAREVEKHLPAERPISAELQLQLWHHLCGKWRDDRSTEEIIQDIRDHRTLGRSVEL